MPYNRAIKDLRDGFDCGTPGLSDGSDKSDKSDTLTPNEYTVYRLDDLRRDYG